MERAEETAERALITLLTDFGSSDGYVGAMKGVILSINPHATLIDLTHDITPQQIAQGGFVLSQAAPFFPAGTTHLAVVDPGVGTASRRPVAIETSRYRFVGPDNGIFGPVLRGEKIKRVIHLTNSDYHNAVVSPTFHGRDIFAPVAAHLSRGVEPRLLGESVRGTQKGGRTSPRSSGTTLTGHVLHIDRFGNCVTNFTARHITSQKMALTAGREVITRFVTTYSEVGKGELVALIGSGGYLEIAKREGNAAVDSGLTVGAKVRLQRGTS